MKRLSIMGAVASLALGCLSLLTPQAAQAAIPPGCTQVASGAYPAGAFSYYCAGTVAADGTTMDNGLKTSGLGLDELRTAYEASPALPGIPFYIFGTPAEYDTAFTAIDVTHTAPGTYDFGVVNYDASNRPTFVAIFKQDSETGTGQNAPKKNTQIGNWAAFYAGRASDALLGYMANGGVLTLPYANISASAGSFDDFYKQLNFDFKLFNFLPPPNQSTPRPPCGSTGVFYEQEDPRKSTPTAPVYLCGTDGKGTSLNSGYSGSNSSILQTIWPNAFGVILGNNAGYSGYFSELAAYTGFGSPDTGNAGLSKDYYFVNGSIGEQFVCSKAFVNWVYNHKELPATVNLPSGCPTVTVDVGATKLFSATPDSVNSFPDGRVFAGVGTDFPTQILSSLEKLGSGTRQAIATKIKTTLQNGNTVVYISTNYSTYDTVFTDAGVTVFTLGNNEDDVEAGGISGPLKGTNYSIGFETTSTNNNLTLQQVTGAVVHELGHDVDYILGWSTQSGSTGSTGFDAAMQNDWVQLDYSVVGSSQTASTPRLPCGKTGTGGYTGPLQGIIDPTVSGGTTDFCTGNTLESKWTGSKYKLVSDILRDPTLAEILLTKLPSGKIGDQTYPGGWNEWYAESFAINGFSDTGANGTGDNGGAVLDAVVSVNKYFACTAGSTGWLSYVYKGATVVHPSTCQSSNLPSWWGTGIN